MIFRNLSLLFAATFVLAACATYSSTTVNEPGVEKKSTLDEPAQVTSNRPATDPAAIILTQQDITDRAYEAIGDIKVTVNKTTLFHSDPTPAQVDERLRDKAADLGADAVILIRYGSVGVSAFSWGSLSGQGRAVYFKK